MTLKAALAAAALIGMATAAPAASAEAGPFGAAASAVTEADLGRIAGKADLAMDARANSVATVSNNRIIGDSTTGTIRFDGSAFQNQAGLSILSANTGNNVAINASLNVNVAIQPPR